MGYVLRYLGNCLQLITRIMQNNYLTDYIESKGYTVQECRRPAKKEVPANMRHRYSTYEEYEEALHDFLNGM